MNWDSWLRFWKKKSKPSNYRVDCFQCGWLGTGFETELEAEEVACQHEDTYNHLAAVVTEEEFKELGGSR